LVSYAVGKGVFQMLLTHHQGFDHQGISHQCAALKE
jgi:hypothetical protein